MWQIVVVVSALRGCLTEVEDRSRLCICGSCVEGVGKGFECWWLVCCGGRIVRVDEEKKGQGVGGWCY